MKHLCDSNVFIALSLEAHPQHKRALQWLEDCSDDSTLFFCRATQSSFLRHLTIREWMKEYVCTNDQAIKAYQSLHLDPRIGFVGDEPANFETQWFKYARTGQSSPKRWMDAYLAAC